MTVLKNERTKKILRLIDTLKVCDVTHIARLYYKSNKYAISDAQKKLTALVKEKTLKRKRNPENLRYYYYDYAGKEPAQIEHKLLLTELYVRICKAYGEANVEIIPEYTKIAGIRPDAYIKIMRDRRIYFLFVEIDISNNLFNQEKYEKAYFSNAHVEIFPNDVFPDILVITDKTLSIKSTLNFIVVNRKFTGLFDKLHVHEDKSIRPAAARQSTKFTIVY